MSALSEIAAAVDDVAEDCASDFFALTAGCPDDAAPVLRGMVWADMSRTIAQTVTDICAFAGIGYLDTQHAIDIAQMRYAALVDGRTVN